MEEIAVPGLLGGGNHLFCLHRSRSPPIGFKIAWGMHRRIKGEDGKNLDPRTPPHHPRESRLLMHTRASEQGIPVGPMRLRGGCVPLFGAVMRWWADGGKLGGWRGPRRERQVTS